MDTSLGEIRPTIAEPWGPHAELAPRTSRESDAFVVRGNGTCSCVGGWQFRFDGVSALKACRIRTTVGFSEIENARDSLVALVVWGDAAPNDYRLGNAPWNYLVPVRGGEDAIALEFAGKVPEGIATLTVRLALRWSPEGFSRWSEPVVEAAEPIEPKPAKVCLVSEAPQTRKRFQVGRGDDHAGLSGNISDQVTLWSNMLEAACQSGPDLIVTPELVIGGEDDLMCGAEVPGPATAPFQSIARKHGASIVLGLRERNGRVFHNSAALIGPDGKIQGIYRKVHLASSEGFSGVTPGASFPVFETPIGALGINICMDTTLVESARICAIKGAEFLCMPIMGDLRADRFTRGQPIFNEDRWRAIMRLHALNNQVCMLVARNEGLGSCVVDRKGELLAWNEGDREFITATVPREPAYQTWNGGCFREVTWHLRRPHLYHDLVDDSRFGELEEAR